MKPARFTSFDVIRLALAHRVARDFPNLAVAITPSRIAWLEPDDEPASADAAFLANALGLKWKDEQ